MKKKFFVPIRKIFHIEPKFTLTFCSLERSGRGPIATGSRLCRVRRCGSLRLHNRGQQKRQDVQAIPCRHRRKKEKMCSLLNQSINQSISQQSINQSINQSICQQSINQSINRSVSSRSINQSINLSAVDQSINQSICQQSINQSINQSVSSRSINQSIALSAVDRSINQSIDGSSALDAQTMWDRPCESTINRIATLKNVFVHNWMKKWMSDWKSTLFDAGVNPTALHHRDFPSHCSVILFPDGLVTDQVCVLSSFQHPQILAAIRLDFRFKLKASQASITLRIDR